MGINATGRRKEIKAVINAYRGYKNQLCNTLPDSKERREKLLEIAKNVGILQEELSEVEHKIEIEPIEDYLVSLGIEENGILPIDHMICRVCHQANGPAIYLDATVFMNHELNDLGKNVRVKVIYNEEGRILLDGILSKEREEPFFKEDKEFQYFKVDSSDVFVNGVDVVINTVSPTYDPEFVHYKYDSESGKYREAHRFSSDKPRKKRVNNFKSLYIPLNPFLGEYNGRLYNTNNSSYMGNLEFDKIIDNSFHMDDIPYFGQPRHITQDKLKDILHSNRVLIGIDTFRIKGPDDSENLNTFLYLDSKGNIVDNKMFYIVEHYTEGYSAPRGVLKCIGVTNETYYDTLEELKTLAAKEGMERRSNPIPNKLDLITAVEKEMIDNLHTIIHSYDIEPQKTGKSIRYQYKNDNGESNE